MSPTYQGFDRTNTTRDIFNSDFIILQKKTPQIGDVILFKPLTENKLYFHRIIAKEVIHNVTYFLTKGDGNRFTDISNIGDTNFGWIPEQNVVGVAVFTVHWIGWFVNEMTSLNFLVPLLALIILLGIIYLNSKKEIKKTTITSKKNSPKHFIKYKIKLITLSKKTLHKILIAGLFAIIIFTFLGIEIVNAAMYPTNVQLLQSDNGSFPDSINFDDPHLFDLENIQYNGQIVFVFNMKLKISSGGLFNSIDSVKLQLESANATHIQDNSEYYYRWVSTYQFAGTKLVNGALILPYSMINTSGNTNLTIHISYTVSHLFFQDHYLKSQSLVVS